MIRDMVVCLLAVLPGFAQNPVLRLDMKRAVEIALAPDGNSRVQLAKEQIRQAESRSAEARAALLPDFEGYVSDQSETANLGSFGINFKLPIPGFQIPQFVGPFDVFDARATVTANVFDFSAIRGFQASRTEIRTAKAERTSADDQVAGLVAKAYLAGLRTEADLETAKANVTLANAVPNWRRIRRRPGRAPASRSRGPRSSWPTSGSVCWWRKMRAPNRI